jgi:hypothetical protein
MNPRLKWYFFLQTSMFCLSIFFLIACAETESKLENPIKAHEDSIRQIYLKQFLVIEGLTA